MQSDELYMRRALELARHGELDASPNPMVGAVIVTPDGTIIGEGWHRRCGESHAEVNAVNSVRNKAMLRQATMYVTLEPCSHFGRTPPCADMIVAHGIPRVVIGTSDPFAKVSGRGIAKLLAAGTDVRVGVLEDECKALNRKFFTAHTEKRPYITLKWAQTASGNMNGHISTPLSAMLVHRERALHDAILVGSGTVIADNPRLDTRLFAGKSPFRVILDRRGRIKGDAPVCSVDGTETVVCSDESLSDVLSGLYGRGVTSLLVEGGAAVLKSFLDAGLYDAIRVEVNPDESCGRNPMVKAPSLPAAPSSAMRVGCNLIYTVIR